MFAKSIRGYKLPPSSLLYRSEEHAVVREEALREEARMLVEKCAEFGVDGQVTQINPGPVVTTFEFRPEAGVKYCADHWFGGRSVPGDGGGVDSDRAHAGQIDRGHSGAEP